MKLLTVSKFTSALLLISLVFTPVALAQEENYGNVVLNADETVDRDYFAGGGNVLIHGTVNGDAYVFGGTILVDGTINGDLIVAGGTVTVAGEVKNDLRAAGGTVSVEGRIGGNVLIGSGNATLTRSSSIGGSVIAGAGIMTIDTPINKNIWLGAGETRINSNLKADASIAAETVTLDTEAKVDGNLTYWSDNQIRLLSGATVSGTIRHEMVEREDGGDFFGLAIGFWLMTKIGSTLALIVIGLLLLRFFPRKTLQVSQEIEKKAFASFGWGLGTIVVTLFLCLVLAISVLGLPLSLLLGLLLAISIYISGIFVAFWIGRKLFGNLDQSKNYHWALIVGMIIFQLLSLLPVLGWLFQAVAVTAGLGALMRVKKETYTDLKAKL
jgi:cytoskeletal protein CcmA (bactofilin family)